MVKVKYQWIKKIKKSIDENPITILIVIIVFFISSFFTILQGVSWMGLTYKRAFQWRDLEYQKINEIRPGMDIRKVNEVFGTPTYTRMSDKNPQITENTYMENDYWIDTFSKNSGEVLFYSVTSCNKNFTPSIQPNPINRKIVLQVSTFNSVGIDPDRLNYSVGVTANTYFFDGYDQGNPSDYEQVFVGWNDVCPPDPRNAISDLNFFLFHTNFHLTDPQIIQFRKNAVVNTYAETAPNVRIENLINYFQIGVDRIEVRNIL